MLDVTQQKLGDADLVVLVSNEGLVEWSAHRNRDQVVEMLRKIAAGIEEGSL